jgi:hypothetical protein
MNLSQQQREQLAANSEAQQLPIESLANGPAAAAILAAGAGCTFMGILGLAANASKFIAKWLTFYPPTGPLSGVSSVAILLWLVTWLTLAKRWEAKTVAMGKVNAAAFVLLALGILLMFPPFADFLRGK